MAGVSAGKILAEAGVNFRIVEAQNYIGGRTRSIQFGSPIVGVYGVNQCASWISGACAPDTPGAPQTCAYRPPETWPGCSYPMWVNPMLNLSQHADPPIEYAQTPLHNWDGTNYPAYLRGGEQIPPGEVTSEYQHWWHTQQCVTERYNCMWQTGPNQCDDMSYGETLDYCGWKAETEIEQAIQWTEFDLHKAADMYEYSTKMSGQGGATWCEYGNQDLYIKDDRGYQGVTLGVADGILSSITLNAPVITVVYDSNGVYVMTGDGTEYHAKYGLVTFSNGVLKNAIQYGNVNFIPPLPQWKQNAIQQLNMVNYSAVYVQWPYKFWNEEPYFEHAEIDDNVVVVLVGDRYGWFPWFINMNHENYRPGSLIWRFDVVSDVAYQIQLQSIEATTQDLLNKISAYFPLTGVPMPLTVHVGTSTVNPYIAGAYESYSVGYDWDGNQADLGHAVGVDNTQPRLYFAGEGTSTKTSSYVLTAYEEGIRAAQEIKVCLGITVPSVFCQGPYGQRNNTSKHHPRKSKR
eukprot:520585_1